MKKNISLTVAWLLVLLASAVADIPKLINYQGMLTNDAGEPLDGVSDILLRIYNAEVGGDRRWEEYHPAVSVSQGLFNVILGSESGGMNLDFSEEYWLEVVVAGEDMPRIRFTSVGYSYRALVADSARVATPGSGSHWTVTDSVIYSNKYWGIARGGGGNVFIGDSAHTHVNLGVACTTGGTHVLHDRYSSVGGGYGNAAAGMYATVSGGWLNVTTGSFSPTVSGGYNNIADNDYATVGGGANNNALGGYSTIAGGSSNSTQYDGATVGGGQINAATFICATVPGGYRNNAEGRCSFAAGRRAKALHAGSFVWADTTNADFASTGDNQFLIRASGGVGIGTNNPGRLLHLLGANPRILLEASSSNPEINFKNSGDLESEVWALYKDGASDNFRFDHKGVDRLTIQDATGNVGVGATDPGQKLDVNGIVRIRSWGLTPTHDVQVNADGDLCKVSSSKRYKKNIRELESDPDKILNLEPVSFEWKTTSEKSIGLIAEDVHELIPDLVGYDNEGRPDAVRYELVSLYLLEAMKELKAENEELRQRIEVLERQ